jgi:dTDP-4-amino-4,6-dideoxygalactose transaminase
MAIRHQLAVYSPIPLAAPLSGVAAAWRLTPDPRPALIELLREEYSAAGVLLAGSGTQALQVAIEIAVRHIGAAGQVVALPAFSCFDVASAAIGAAVSAALYDVDPETLGPDLDSLERVLAAGVRVGVIAPLYGMPVDWETLDALATRYGAMLIEDSAQGHGAFWRGNPLGSLGDTSTLSFGRGKGWTGGRGGAVLVRRRASLDSTRLAEVGTMKEGSTVAGLLAQWTLGRPAVYGIPHSIPALGLGETTFHPPVSPALMPRAAAAAVLNAMTASREEAARRRENAAWFLERIPRNDELRSVRVVKDSVPGYLRLPLRVSGGVSGMSQPTRASSLGVAPSYPRTLVELAPQLAGPERRWPGAELLARDLVTLPTHSRLSPVERDEIVRMLQQKRR